jgi:glycosyltransferase involved in cell wall biosynthesis
MTSTSQRRASASSWRHANGDERGSTALGKILLSTRTRMGFSASEHASAVPLADRLRVAHVVSSLEIGGQERVVLDLSRGLRARGHEVSVISLAPGGALRPRFEGVPIVDVARRPGLDARLVVALAAALRSLAPDVVHTHNPAAMIYGAPAARLARVPHVVHTKHGENPRSRLAQATFARLCDVIVAVSSEAARVARERDLVPARRLRVVPNAIDVGAYERDEAAGAALRASLGIAPDACVIGTVGRAVKLKRHDLLVDAVAPSTSRALALVIVGDGPERDAVTRRVPARARPFVHLVGARDDVRSALSAFDVFALPSDAEGVPLALVEAMAAGLAVVATAVGGVPDVIRDGVDGVLVARGDAGLRFADGFG